MSRGQSSSLNNIQYTISAPYTSILPSTPKEQTFPSVHAACADVTLVVSPLLCVLIPALELRESLCPATTEATNKGSI